MIITTKKATREQTKNHNKGLVLKNIYDYNQISRASIARATNLTRTTVSGAVAELIDEGLVEEVGQGPSAGGKRPTLLSVIDDARHLIGLDLANSTLQGAIINLRGEIKHRMELSVDPAGGEVAIQQVYTLLDNLVKATDRPLLGIGIGTPGVVDTKQGVVQRAVNLGWENVPLRDLLGQRYDLPVYVANDSHVAALAEYTFGQLDNIINLIVVKAGRGIGAGIVLNGHLFYGDGFGAGEIGHVVVVKDGEQCTCGNFGCLETVASSRSIIKSIQTLLQNDPNSSLHQHFKDPQQITMTQVLQAFKGGNSDLIPIIDRAGHYLGVAVANLVGALNIQHILIAGRLAQFEQVLLEALQAAMSQCVLATLANKTQIQLTQLGSDIVLLGAGALLLTHELGLT